jgi:bla regulator protein BlaR1
MMIYIQPFFDWLLDATVIGSVVICLILAIQKTLGGKLGPRWSHALWLVLLIRMALPWAPSSRISLFNLIPSWDRQAQPRQQLETAEQPGPSKASQSSGTTEAMPAQKPKPDAAIHERTTAKPAAPVDMQNASKGRLGSLRQVLPALWLVGAIVIGAYVLVSDLALWRIVKRDRPLVNQAMLELFEECKTQMGVQSLVAIVPSSQIRSP